MEFEEWWKRNKPIEHVDPDSLNIAKSWSKEAWNDAKKDTTPTDEELIALSKIAEQLEKDIAVFDLSPCLPLDRIMHNIQILKGNQPSEEGK